MSTKSLKDQVIGRYRDAYRVARVTAGFGSAIKIIGILFAGVIGFLSLRMAERGGGDAILVLGIGIAVFIALLFFVIGVIVSANGQMLGATLDSAVNTSTAITDLEKMEILSLKSGR